MFLAKLIASVVGFALPSAPSPMVIFPGLDAVFFPCKDFRAASKSSVLKELASMLITLSPALVPKLILSNLLSFNLSSIKKTALTD